MTVKGKLKPLGSKIIVTDLNFGMETSKGGIVLVSDNGKTAGIHPRWARVYAIGPEQKDVKIGEWILLEHGRWSRMHKYETESGEIISIHLADENAILAVTDEKPNDVIRGVD